MGVCPEFIILSGFHHLRRRAGRYRPGFSLLEIMIIVALLSLLLSIAAPNWVRARTSAQSRACARNLRAIQTAKEQYGILHRLPAGASGFTFTDLVNDGLLSQEPVCPEGFSYVLGGMSEDPTCPSSMPGHTLYP